MRQDTVNILEYLPRFLWMDPNFHATNHADSKEHDRIRLLLQDLLNQVYVDTATWGLPLWESLVEITVRNDAPDWRRNEVKAKLRAAQSVTQPFLQAVVEMLVAGQSVRVIDVPTDYRLDIELCDGVVRSWQRLDQTLRMWVPAHIGWKYIARTDASLYLRVGAIVTVADIIHIDAQTDFVLPAPQEDIAIGIAVSTFETVHIEADVYQ
jgi:phage-like element PBSX protein xkdU|nr:MAG TPA: tail protein [Caudoviricetes sp.]